MRLKGHDDGYRRLSCHCGYCCCRESLLQAGLTGPVRLFRGSESKPTPAPTRTLADPAEADTALARIALFTLCPLLAVCNPHEGPANRASLRRRVLCLVARRVSVDPTQPFRTWTFVVLTRIHVLVHRFSPLMTGFSDGLAKALFVRRPRPIPPPPPAPGWPLRRSKAHVEPAARRRPEELPFILSRNFTKIPGTRVDRIIIKHPHSSSNACP